MNAKRTLRQIVRDRLQQLPFSMRLGSVFPGTFRAYVPDRYWTSTGSQKEWTVPPSSMRGFLAGNETNNTGDLPRYFFLRMVCEQLVKEGVKGNVAELGVYKGNTACMLASVAREFGTTAYLFDTFGGFSGADLVGIDVDKRSGAQFRDTSLQAVRALVGEENVSYVVGHFPESAAQLHADLQFNLVHIDCDLYAPFCAALDYFYPRMVPGGFLIMHDYNSRSWNGAEKAVDEFFLERPEWVIPIPDKSGTVVIRKC